MIGTVLRIRYELSQLLSDGPIFTTYLANDRVFGREVCVRVVKKPYADEPEFVKRLSETVERYSKLKHEGVETILEVDSDDDAVFLVSQTSEGSYLRDRIKKLAPFSVPVSIAIAISICEALESVHKAKLVHGDVSSFNSVIDSDGRVRLQLTGIWESYSGSASAGSAVLPTMAAYLAPEISSGSMPSPSSDCYSVGVLLYELLTGRQPYVGETAIATIMKHANSPTPGIRMHNPSAPVVLDEIVKKALAKNPVQRYQDAGEMLSDLRVLQDALRFGKSLSWPIRPQKVSPAPEQPVAPKMSAVRTEEKLKAVVHDDVFEETERDVPAWMMGMILFFGLLLALLVGAWFVFNMNKPQFIQVPNIKDVPVSDARNMLSDMGLELHISRRETSDLPIDTVLEVSPSVGRQVREGGRVSVVLSSGSRFVIVPDLRGLSVDDAKSQLEGQNLVLDDRMDEKRNPSIERGLIVEQIPEPRTKVERSTRVKVTLSSGDSTPERRNTDGDKRYLYRLKIGLSKVDEPVNLRVDITDDRGTRTIHEEVHQPDEEVVVSAYGYGPEANFRIFFDGELVKQLVQKAEDNN